jgi:uncharacterized membrane protein YfcA
VIEIFSLIAVGCCAGFTAGLLGLGGGLVIVPLLAIILDLHGFPSGEVMRVAVATSLGVITLTALSSAYAHYRHGAVQWPLVWRLGIGLACGALVSSYLVDLLPQIVLKALFACVELIVAYQLYTGKEANAGRTLPKTFPLIGTGGIFGLFSGLVGMGGGTFIVPFLVWCNVSMRQAVATSSACGFFIAAAAVAGYVFLVEPDSALPEGSVGYLYLPALFLIALTSVLFAPLGARYAHRIPAEKLRRIFSLTLVLMVMILIFG